MDNFSLRDELEKSIKSANADIYFKDVKKLTTLRRSRKYLSDFLSTQELNILYGLYLFLQNNPNVSDSALEDAILNNKKLKILNSLYQENHDLIIILKQFEFGRACKLIASKRERVKTGDATQFWEC